MSPTVLPLRWLFPGMSDYDPFLYSDKVASGVFGFLYLPQYWWVLILGDSSTINRLPSFRHVQIATAGLSDLVFDNELTLSQWGSPYRFLVSVHESRIRRNLSLSSALSVYF